ncbi:hypothetical protein BC941DRAFT_451843 [Chlamydoabsidia padenii]|nr:hypothetical protein BC941DRAFT_451843 [Chlamydoabsidia padenii]
MKFSSSSFLLTSGFFALLSAISTNAQPVPPPEESEGNQAGQSAAPDTSGQSALPQDMAVFYGDGTVKVVNHSQCILLDSATGQVNEVAFGTAVSCNFYSSPDCSGPPNGPAIQFHPHESAREPDLSDPSSVSLKCT